MAMELVDTWKINYQNIMHIYALTVCVIHIIVLTLLKKKNTQTLSPSPLFEIPLQSPFSAVQLVSPFSKGNSHGVLSWATEIKASA